MISSSPNTLWRYGFFNLAILVLISAWFWQQNTPVSLAEPQLPADGKLQCVSYAPYYGEGQTPFIVGTRISQLQIESDLKLLAERSRCVRIYSVGQGLDYVPEAASKIGLKVLLGAWIGWVKAENEMELNLATKLANEYPQTVIGLVVGNEVLLRGEQTEQAMLVRRVVPVIAAGEDPEIDVPFGTRALHAQPQGPLVVIPEARIACQQCQYLA